MIKQLSVFICGLLFSTGLIVSGMINPAKVIGFLNLFGQWDPSLGFVMAGAVAVTFIGNRFVMQREQPYFAPDFAIPSRTDIDSPLLFGPVLFGIGWGLVGLCPGPAIAALATSLKTTWLFFLAMIAGMFLMQKMRSKTHSSGNAALTN